MIPKVTKRIIRWSAITLKVGLFVIGWQFCERAHIGMFWTLATGLFVGSIAWPVVDVFSDACYEAWDNQRDIGPFELEPDDAEEERLP